MDELEKVLATFVNQAKEAMRAENYELAMDRLLNAQKSALLLAKRTTGAVREKHVAYAKSLKELYAQVSLKNDIKNASAPPKKSNDDYRPEPPKAPVNNNTNVNNTPPKEDSNTSRPYQPPKRNDALRPLYLSDYIGQPGAVMAVRDLITAARLKNSAMPHLIVYGSHGLGKTTFAKIIANEMNVGFTEVNVTKITPDEMVAILKKLKERDIIFIDEIHTLPLVVAESILYSAMQDGMITYTEGKGKLAKTQTIELPHFTLIGATTEIGKLAKPFIHRAIQVRLEEYTDEVLSGIIKSSFGKLGLTISEERALVVAKRCRNNPRTANNIVKRISDKAIVRYAQLNNLTSSGSLDSPDAIRKLGIEINDKVIEEFFKENGIDEWGLEGGDRELLNLIIKRYNGGPVGIDTLARAMNESNNVIAQKYEAYLIKKGMLRVDRDGRVAMALAYKALGLPVPDDKKDQLPDANNSSDSTNNNSDSQGGSNYNNNNNYNSNNDNSGNNNYQNNNNYSNNNNSFNNNGGSDLEKFTVMASDYHDELKCRKVEELIVYPENVKTFTDDLNDMFPDVEQPFEGETKHCCELEVDFKSHKRTLICDSKLECKFATMMASVGFLNDIKAQTLEIPYISQALANRRYFPDFVVRDYKNRIAVIEMKNFNMASYHLNIDKYEQLKRYCESQGFGYSEIMKEYDSDMYVSFDMLLNAPINRNLEQFIIERIKENDREKGEPVFTEQDFEDYIAQNGSTSRSQLHTVLLNNRELKNVDRVGNNMKIMFNN